MISLPRLQLSIETAFPRWRMTRASDAIGKTVLRGVPRKPTTGRGLAHGVIHLVCYCMLGLKRLHGIKTPSDARKRRYPFRSRQSTRATAAAGPETPSIDVNTGIRS